MWRLFTFLCARTCRPSCNARCGPRASYRTEGLEQRVLLSAMTTPFQQALRDHTLTDEQLKAEGWVSMEWNGQAVYAEAGEWVVGLEHPRPTFGPDGKVLALNIDWAGPNERAPEIERFLDRSALDVTFERYLGSKDIFLVRTAASATADQVAAALRGLDKFEVVEPNMIGWGNVTIPNETNAPGRFNDQYHLNNTGQSGGTNDADIDAPEAWDITRGSSGTVVGVIDTGAILNHPDLAGNIWTNPADPIGDANNDGDLDDDFNDFDDDWRGWDFVGGDNDPTDAHGHGTASAGVVAAEGNNGVGVTGVAWDAAIMPIRAGDQNNAFPFTATVDAIRYATMMRDRGVNIRVTNNSYGGFGDTTIMRNAIEANGNAGMLFVTAAGNDDGRNIDTLPTYPASYDLPNIVTVAATTRNDNLASFSNVGAVSVDLGAAGDDVLTTVKLTDDPNIINDYFHPTGYNTVDGTSFAAPQVAGVAALAFTLRPEESHQFVKAALLNGGDAVAALSGTTVSGRRLNARGTLNLINPASVVANGDLNGAPTNDGIVVRRDPLDLSVLEVFVNSVSQSRTPYASVASISVHGLGGNDLLQVDANVGVPVRMIGGNGDDRLEAGAGNDVLYGDAGNDTLYGSGGNDFHDGQWGNDFSDGQGGDDTFVGEVGADNYLGGAGVDVINYSAREAPFAYDYTYLTLSLDDQPNDGEGGEADNIRSDVEHVVGSRSNDSITGSAAANILWGRGGKDDIIGGGGDDVLHGEAGNDRLNGGDGSDTHNGGDNDDTLFANPGPDTYNGGAGANDEANYESRTGALTEPLTIDIDGAPDDGGASDGPTGARDNVGTDVENAVGGSGADTITGSADNNNLLHGGFGADTLNGLGGNDELRGDPLNFTYPYQPVGADSLFGGDGDDYLRAVDNLVDTVLDGGNGVDRVDRDGSDPQPLNIP